jgi:hypothetical protein
MKRFQFSFALILLVACAHAVRAANWSVARVNHAVITPPSGATIAEMSGVTYLGPVGNAHRFLAAEETKGELVQFDLTFTAAGGISAVSNVTAVDIVPTNDFEGIAYTNPERNSVFLSSETGSSLREISLATGAELQTVATTKLWGAQRPNLALESLTRSADGATMWTANEQAITADGSTSTASAGTPVRLFQLDVAGDIVTHGSQFVYHVEPIHGSSPLGSPQSGLSDLAMMPDGTLLALERSVAVTSPIYLNRIYEIDFAGATDVTQQPYTYGVLGQVYVPVGKSLRWSGAIDASFGQNMEGLTLGPRLTNGQWSLIGVVDNGDGSSGNTIVAFTATLLHSADFNADGAVNGADFLRWQQGQGKLTGATFEEGDADLNGAVDAADLGIWKALFGGPQSAAAHAIPEPATALLAIAAALALMGAKRTFISPCN